MATAFLAPLPQGRSRAAAYCPSSGRRPGTRLAALQELPGAFLDGPSPSPSTTWMALAPEAQMVFEPKLDAGALTSLLVVAAVVLVFWLRVWVAVSDRLKRENLEKVQKEVLLKRLSGTMKDDDAEALRRAIEEEANPVLGPLGTWLRGVQLINGGRSRDEEEQEQQGGGGGR